VDFRLLGSLEVIDDDGGVLALRSGQQRAVLALLLLWPNRLVTSDTLIEQVWGPVPPATARKMLQNQISGLRRTLGRYELLATEPGGYLLAIHDGERDVDRFERLLALGRERFETGDVERAATVLRQALDLWRGPPLADLGPLASVRIEVARLEERRLVALEERIDADLMLGRQADLVAELEAAVAEQPLRERLRAQLMLALYRCGRQAEALAAYRAARGTLVGELGIEPSLALKRLERAILTQDVSLDE
jgi:DNA-binding SARP family transcriptional activator